MHAADYIYTQTLELKKLAERDGLDLLAYFLDMAAEQAKQAARSERRTAKTRASLRKVC